MVCQRQWGRVRVSLTFAELGSRLIHSTCEDTITSDTCTSRRSISHVFSTGYRSFPIPPGRGSVLSTGELSASPHDEHRDLNNRCYSATCTKYALEHLEHRNDGSRPGLGWNEEGEAWMLGFEVDRRLSLTC